MKDALLRVKGVSQVDLAGGAEYGMRIWLQPDKLANLKLTPSDVIGAIKQQNIQAPAGQIGASPSKPNQQLTYTVLAPGKFSTPEEFGEILVRATDDGRQVRVKDVARVELGGEFYKSFGALNGKPAGVLLIYLLPGANQIESAKGVYAEMDRLKRFFPDDVDYAISYDTTPAVQASISGIVQTLFETTILVVLVVFLFLQNVRATLIPLLTVVVSLLGTFAVFPLLGFSVNTLSLFGLVLAIGIVVDDAIVVVEAVMHHIEQGMSPKDATVQAMKEVSGPIVATTLIMAAVFIPVAFMGGLVGQLYQQFALTIAISGIISAFNALSLSPALSAILLKPHSQKRSLLGRFFGGFNQLFTATTNGYMRLAGGLARKAVLSVGIVAVVAAGAGGFAKIVPGGFVPDEDQGILLRQRAVAQRRFPGAHAAGLRAGQHHPRQHARHRALQRHWRHVLPERHFYAQRGLVLRPAERLERAQDARDQHAGFGAAAQRPIAGLAGLHRVSVHAARAARVRRGGRIQFRAPGSQRQPFHPRIGRPGFSLHGRGAEAAGVGGLVHRVRSALTADSSWT